MSRGLIGRDARKQCVVKQIAESPLYPGGLNRSMQHLIFNYKDGDVSARALNASTFIWFIDQLDTRPLYSY